MFFFWKLKDNFWNIYEKFMRNLWEIYWKLTGTFCKIYGTFMWNLWEIDLMGNLCEIYVKFIKIDLKKKLKNDEFIGVSSKKLIEYAFPKVIDKFLEDNAYYTKK